MKSNYRFTIAYDGSRYLGWEHQPGTEMTIQGKLEKVLEWMTGESVEILGAGRTDKGVHAQAMTAHAHLNTSMTVEEIRDYMNRYLPEDICVKQVQLAAQRFHSRYNAVGKTYRYTCYVGETKPLFHRKYVYALEEMPNLETMRQAAKHLTGTHDYASFCTNRRMKKSTVRTVDSIEIVQKGEYIMFTYHGTGFLQHMVRIMTGTLLEVGFGLRSPESMVGLLEEKERVQAGFTAPARGLCLVEVEYH